MGEPIWSTGGAGGERAVAEDLEWAAGALRAAAAYVASASMELARRRAALALGPGMGHAALAGELGHGVEVLARRVEDDLDDCAQRLAAVTAAYLDAERSARHRVGLIALAREGFEDATGTQAWLTRVGVAGVLATGPLGPLLGGAILPDSLPPDTSVVNRRSVEGALDSPSYTALLAAIDAVMGFTLLALLTRWGGGLTAARVRMAPVHSLEDLMWRLRETERAGGGAVRIERWTGADGVTRRIVFIPGTRDWLNLTPNPSDLGADVSLLAGQLPDAAAVVAAALEADGAKSGDPVMLTGHSLGGIVATALAANPQVLTSFDIRAVVTAGSPVGRIALPPGVNALHLEGTRDVVPGLDGRPNPDTPTRTTVHHDARDSRLAELRGEGEDMGSAHSLDTYAQTARLVDQGLGASTDAWLTEEADFFAPSERAVVTEYRP